VQTKFRAEFGAVEPAIAKFREEAELDGGEENFGGPEAEGRLENWTGI
jgi:hypothetical protein